MTEEIETNASHATAELERATAAWVGSGVIQPLERWLARELDEEGTPRRLPIAAWWGVLGRLLHAQSSRAGWPRRLDAPILSLARSLLRFARLDGTPTLATAAEGGATPSINPLAEILRLHPTSREARVASWLLGKPEPNHAPPPLPAWRSPHRPLATLRANWQKKGDLLVVDQRSGSPAAGLELVGAGVHWLGPSWRLGQAGEMASAGKPTHWHSSSTADLFEWSYRAAGLRMTRTALVLRGRRIALLAEQVSLGKQPVPELGLQVSLAAGVRAAALSDARGVSLTVDGNRANAQVLPIGLPALPYETERGRFEVAGNGQSLALTARSQGRRCWLPLLVSWEPSRHRKRLSWRVLTITQEGRVCRPDEAFAARVTWGRDDTLVVYRSLGPPAHRAFLGHQTHARFLVGQFNDEGVVEPLLTVDA